MSFNGAIINDQGALTYNESGQILSSIIDNDGQSYNVFLDQDVVVALSGSQDHLPDIHCIPVGEISNADKENFPPSSSIVNASDSNIASTSTVTSLSWSKEATKKLFDLHTRYIPDIGPNRRFIYQCNMFQHIAEKLSKEFKLSFTATQCKNRISAIKDKQNKAIHNNRLSGNIRQEVPFEEERAKLRAIDDSLEPEVEVGVGVMRHNKKPKLDKPYRSSTRSSSKKDLQSVMESFMQLQKQKGEEKNRRHTERLMLLKQLLERKGGNCSCQKKRVDDEEGDDEINV